MLRHLSVTRSQFASPLYKLVFALSPSLASEFFHISSQHSVLSHDCQLQFKTRATLWRWNKNATLHQCVSTSRTGTLLSFSPAKSTIRKGRMERVDSCAVNFIKFRLADLRRCSKRVERTWGAVGKLIDCRLYLHIFLCVAPAHSLHVSRSQGN